MNEQFQILFNAIELGDIETFKHEWSLEIANSCYDRWGCPLLHNAAFWSGRSEFVHFMLEKGADPNIRSTKMRATPLMYGWLSHDQVRVAVHLMLLRKGGNPYLTTTDGVNSFREENATDYMEGFLVVELVCGEADNFSIDLWRVVKPFIYNI